MKTDNDYVPGELDLSIVWGAGEVDEAQRRPQITILGAGSMGAEHIHAIEAVGEADVVGIYDPNPGSLDYCLKKYPRLKTVKVYASLEEACSDPASDSVIIATPNYTHLDILKMVCTYDKHILLEKPIASSVEDSREIVEISRSYDKVLYIGLEYRHKPIYQELLYELKVRKTAGSIRMINIMEHRRPFLNKWNEWNKFSEYSGGTMIEKCCHYFDLFNLIAESQPIKVYASGGQDVNFLDFEHGGKKSDIIDNAFAVIDYENGIRACLNLCMFMFCGGAKEQIIVNGNRASLYAVDHPENTLEIKVNGRSPSRHVKVDAPTGIAEVGGHSGSTYYEHLDFYKTIRFGRSPAVSASDGFLAIAVGKAVEESIRIGDPVLMKEIIL